jgi:hypothetical protein
LRRRFADERVAGLLEAAWWTWRLERIRARAGLLCASNIDAFLAANAGLTATSAQA